jgi:hypothetical protein
VRGSERNTANNLLASVVPRRNQSRSSLAGKDMTTFWIIVVFVALIGILLFKRSVDRTPDLTAAQVAELIDKFVDGSGGPYDWDDYINIPSRNAALEQIRRDCEEVSERFPPETKTEWCSPAGGAELKRLAQKARQLAQQTAAPLPRAPAGQGVDREG